MKRLILLGVVAMLVTATARSWSLPIVVDAGVGAVVPDNENVESAPAGKVEARGYVAPYLSMGVSFTQTGRFNQTDKPAEVRDSLANPSAFAGKRFHHDYDGPIDTTPDYDDPDVTYNITVAPDPLPKRPEDRTESHFWAGEVFVRPSFWFKRIEIFGKAFVGGSGIKMANGQTDIAISRGLGCGVSYDLFNRLTLGVEAIRRHQDTGHNTYGSWEGMFRGSVGW